MSKLLGKLLTNIVGGQQGFGFTMVLIMIAVTAVLSVPLLEYLSSVLHRSSNINSTLDGQYSMDAGTEDAMWRLAYDLPFLALLVVSSPQSYTLTLNGQTVTNTVSSLVQGPPPTPALPPPCGTGNCIVWWTWINPSVVSLAEGETRLTIYIRNGGTSNAQIRSIRELLPPGFEYDGDLLSVNLVDNHGAPFVLGSPSVSGPQWSYTGPDIIDNCNPRSSTQADNQQRLSWDWSSGSTAPQVEPGATAQISFQIERLQITPPGVYWDMPWMETIPPPCASGLNAGRPSSVTVSSSVTTTYTAIVESKVGNNSLTSQVEVKPNEHKINAQRHGN